MSQESAEPSVFISYSHDSEEHKNWVLQLATRLRSNGVDIVLDRWNVKLGSDLASFMERRLSQSQRVICVCSDTYVIKANEGRGGSGYEKQIITAELVKDQNTNWVIPLIMNNSGEPSIPTFLGGRRYVDFRDSDLYERNYEELLRDLLNEPVLPIPPLGKNPFQNAIDFAREKFLPASEKYVSPAATGVVSFDYSNNNGRYSLGQGELLFECSFSKAGKTRIYIYTDAPSIRSVAIAKGVVNFADIGDGRIFDTSSRVRTIGINEIGIFQNKNGFYAAIRILEIKDDTREDTHDEVRFEYFIQTNGSPDFTK